MKWWSWLASVRSVVALAITGTFCYLAITKVIPPDKVMEIVLLVITFYYLKQRSIQANGGEQK